MIITFGTQKGGVGKTTLAVAFANYLTLFKGKQVVGYDFDYQKSFYKKWEEDEMLPDPKLYDVLVIEKMVDFDEIIAMQESETIYIFDLAGTLDESYVDLLTYSDFIICPFEYSGVSVKSTLVFINLLTMIESEAEKIFVRSRYDKGYNYPNQTAMDVEISQYGFVAETPVYKRNILQTINTRRLDYELKKSVEDTFEEILNYINETKQTAIFN